MRARVSNQTPDAVHRTVRSPSEVHKILMAQTSSSCNRYRSCAIWRF